MMSISLIGCLSEVDLTMIVIKSLTRQALHRLF